MKWVFSLSLLAVQFSGAMAQKLEIGIVEYYGISAPGAPAKGRVEGCLPFKVGTLIDAENKNIWKDPAIACLKNLPGIKQANIEAVCCDENNRAMIFVGLSQRTAPVDTKQRFSAEVQLPASVVAAYDTLMDGALDAIQSGQAQEDDSKGHALFRYPKAAESQALFAAYAAANLSTLRTVLHSSRHGKHREVASWVIAFNEDKKAIAEDLVAAVRDPSENVRNNAVRALGILDNYFKQTKVEFRIDSTPFVELMNSISWSDRNKSANLLLSLTRDREPALMAQLKQDALYSLADMARWKSKGHAYAAFMILGRLSEWEDRVTDQRANEDRDKWVGEILLALSRSK